MDTPKSGFVAALENFWNSFASARNDIVLIVCASATSWMLSKVIHNKGGLYHRLTEQIHLQPFSFGGVPFYWELLEKGSSIDQNIDRVLFAKDAVLKDEFRYLYASVFKNPQVYIRLVKALCTVKSGLTREELIKDSGVSNSGDLTRRLEELESCGFIRSYSTWGKKKKTQSIS